MNFFDFAIKLTRIYERELFVFLINYLPDGGRTVQ